MRAGGWEGRLAAYIEDAGNTAFRWGHNDCALWAAEWVRLCTGTDFGGDWSGRYRTEAGAARLMKRRGFGGVSDIADAHLTAKPVMLARRGDLVLHPQGCLGVCDGAPSFFVTDRGLTSIPTLMCERAWEVG